MPSAQGFNPQRFYRESSQLPAGETSEGAWCGGCWDKIRTTKGRAGISILATSGLLQPPAKTEVGAYLFLSTLSPGVMGTHSKEED